MSYWIPKPTGKQVALDLLDERERLVLSRVDGETSVSHLNLLPGLSERIVGPILDHLVQLGLLEPMSDSEPSLSSRPSPRAGRCTGGLAALVSPPTRPPTGEAATMPEPPTAPAKVEPTTTTEPATTTDESDPPAVEDSDPSERDTADVDRSEPAEGDADADEPTDADADAGSMPDELARANFRRLYETQLKHLTRDQRIGLAQTVTGEVLYALCHDEFPGVIEAILSNPSCGLNHARLVVRHHNKAMGLDNVARRTQFLTDALVQRHLLRNVQTPESVLKKLLRMKPLIGLYKLCFGRELSEPATRAARQTLRSRFQSAPPEETVTLVFTTEGRCLQLLAGIPLDEAFTALFTKRPVNSMLLIQNLLRHAATPPSILRHLWKQPLLKRQRHLRDMLVKHPNCPSEYKRA